MRRMNTVTGWVHARLKSASSSSSVRSSSISSAMIKSSSARSVRSAGDGDASRAKLLNPRGSPSTRAAGGDRVPRALERPPREPDEGRLTSYGTPEGLRVRRVHAPPPGAGHEARGATRNRSLELPPDPRHRDLQELAATWESLPAHDGWASKDRHPPPGRPADDARDP